jgi:hypothetical protein
MLVVEKLITIFGELSKVSIEKTIGIVGSTDKEKNMDDNFGNLDITITVGVKMGLANIENTSLSRD